MRKKPLWKKILEELKREIANNGFRTGDKFYPLKEITRKYGVSSITAKRVYQELEAEQWIKKYPGRGTFILKNHTPIEIKVFLPETQSLDNSSHFIVARILLGISEAAKETGSKLATFSNVSFAGNSKGDDCFIIFQALTRKEIFLIPKDRIFCVMIHSYSPVENCSNVGIDFKKGACMAVKHLLSLGHRRIGFVCGMISQPWHTKRFQGYQKGLRSAKIKLDWQLIKETSGTKPEEDQQAFEELMELKEPPTAIFTANDSRAHHILEYCYKHGITVPDDLSIAGFDNLPESALCNPPLTTVDTNLTEMGKQAVCLLMDLFKPHRKREFQNILVTPQLVLRESTASNKEKVL